MDGKFSLESLTAEITESGDASMISFEGLDEPLYEEIMEDEDIDVSAESMLSSEINLLAGEVSATLTGLEAYNSHLISTEADANVIQRFWQWVVSVMVKVKTIIVNTFKRVVISIKNNTKKYSVFVRENKSKLGAAANSKAEVSVSINTSVSGVNGTLQSNLAKYQGYASDMEKMITKIGTGTVTVTEAAALKTNIDDKLTEIAKDTKVKDLLKGGSKQKVEANKVFAFTGIKPAELEDVSVVLNGYKDVLKKIESTNSASLKVAKDKAKEAIGNKDSKSNPAGGDVAEMKELRKLVMSIQKLINAVNSKILSGLMQSTTLIGLTYKAAVVAVKNESTPTA